MAAAAPLQIDFPRVADLHQQPATWWRDVLGVVSYAPDGAALDWPLPNLPAAHVMMPVLSGHDVAEVWRLEAPMQTGRHGRVQYRCSDRMLFATLSVPERDFATPDSACKSAGDRALRDATRTVYRELFAALSALGFPHPLRIWNVLPQINGQGPEGERYWQFNGARQDAFIGERRQITGSVPAASALGSPRDGPLTVYCLASALAPIALENPRQSSAWNYPAQYGPSSPTFARGCIESGPVPTLFVSGTASILGHETAHAGDVGAQTRETLRNIDAVLCAANERLGGARFALEQLSYKVYVRRPADLARIEQELRAAIGPRPRTLYLNADICRRELLVEIEAVGT